MGGLAHDVKTPTQRGLYTPGSTYAGSRRSGSLNITPGRWSLSHLGQFDTINRGELSQVYAVLGSVVLMPRRV
jgi:hypothetical protein